MTDLAARDFRRILILKPSSPGDIIHALPVLHGLRRRFLTAHLAWLVATPFVDLIGADPALNEVIPFDRRRFGGMWRSPMIAREFLTFVRSLRARRFDLVIDLQGLFRSGFLAWASGAGVRLGLADAREGAWLFHTKRLSRPTGSGHAADLNYRVAETLGFADAPPDFTIHRTAEDEAAAGRLLAEAIGAADRPFAVLVPGTRWETKCWPAERFGQLARTLRDRHGLPSILVGGRDDQPRGQAAVAAAGGAAADLCGRTTLRQLAALIARSAVVVTADSTPMHMTAALDRPLEALFGPTNPERTGPWRRGEAVVRLDLACSPCYLRNLRQCQHGHECMDRLDVARVAAATAERLLTAKRAE